MSVPNSSRTSYSPWLFRYASGYHRWKSVGQTHYRPLGIVEGFFDTDGTEFEGRADIAADLRLDIRTCLPSDKVRQRILLAWAILRCEHVLLSTKAVDRDQLPCAELSAQQGRYFLFEQPTTVSWMLEQASRHIVFAADDAIGTDPDGLFTHLLNTCRAIDPAQSLARLFVYPLETTDKPTLRCIFVLGHQILDGLTTFRWTSHFIELLNLPAKQLEDYAEDLTTADVPSRLPPAQEELYPPVKGIPARQRWSWLISRLLRHTRRPPPASFPNPLRRREPMKGAEPLSNSYPKTLDYSRLPPLNGYSQAATLSTPATRNVARLCKEARISLGAGSFALVALVMMLFYERRFPHVPLEQRKPFVGSFPLNPRPFLSGEPTTGKEDSLMLAFSDGLTLPFLPSNLQLEGRFKLLGRLADKQLRVYQKRPRNATEVVELGSRSPNQMIPNLYIGSVERMEAKAPPHLKMGINPQGAYPVRQSETLATCGVSSVGDRTKLIASGKYDLTDDMLVKKNGLVADFRSLRNAVRPRDGEFLVGAAGDKNSLGFSVSYDGCAIDPKLAEEWAKIIEQILEPEEERDADFKARL